ncbi:MAG: phosphopantothenoylcysteine decarboxylase [Verrucomicrobiota bacterium]
MRCLVTAGPTGEPLDRVRRLTNFSTGRLGTRLAEHLAAAGHTVQLLRSETAVFRPPGPAVSTVAFGSTADLEAGLRAWRTSEPVAVFHAAAVSDFAFGALWNLAGEGEPQPVSGSKIASRGGRLLAELLPTPKILPQLRSWFPRGFLVGWKYETDGDRARVVALGRAQLAEARTDACVVNGPGYGPGFGLVRPGMEPVELAGEEALFRSLTTPLGGWLGDA